VLTGEWRYESHNSQECRCKPISADSVLLPGSQQCYACSVRIVSKRTNGPKGRKPTVVEPNTRTSTPGVNTPGVNLETQHSNQKIKGILRGAAFILSTAFCLGNASQAWAQSAPPTITLTVSGLSCSTTAGPSAFQAFSWSEGVQNVPKAALNVSDLTILKQFDACSPALFGAVTAGSKFATVKLVQTNSTGGPLLTVTMTGATITGWSENSSGFTPTESVSIGFSKICLEEATSGSTVCSQKN
jgi:type VI protein secretion system component Hcp